MLGREILGQHSGVIICKEEKLSKENLRRAPPPLLGQRATGNHQTDQRDRRPARERKRAGRGVRARAKRREGDGGRIDRETPKNAILVLACYPPVKFVSSHVFSKYKPELVASARNSLMSAREGVLSSSAPPVSITAALPAQSLKSPSDCLNEFHTLLTSSKIERPTKTIVWSVSPLAPRSS